MGGALQRLKLAWQFYWQQYWQVGNRATERCRFQLRFGYKLHAVDRDLFLLQQQAPSNAWNVRDSFSQSSNEEQYNTATTGTQQRLERMWQFQSKQ